MTVLSHVTYPMFTADTSDWVIASVVVSLIACIAAGLVYLWWLLGRP